jgi:hypothetical protein
MHAVGYRPRLSFVVLALVTLIGLGLFAASSSTRSRSCGKWRSAHAAKAKCSPHAVWRADEAYRAKRFTVAEQMLRDAARCKPPKLAEELHVIASFYRELNHSWTRAMVGPYREREVHLDAAIRIDGMLGGAHADELSREKHRVLSALGPE